MQQNNTLPSSHLVHPKEWGAAAALLAATAVLRWTSLKGGVYFGCYNEDDVRRIFMFYCWPDVDVMCRSFLWPRWELLDGVCNVTDVYGVEFERYWDAEDLSKNCSVVARPVSPRQRVAAFIQEAERRLGFELTDEHNALISKVDDVFGRAGDQINAFVQRGQEVHPSFFERNPPARAVARNIIKYNVENLQRVFSGIAPVQKGILQERSVLTDEQLWGLMNYTLDLCRKGWRNEQYLIMMPEFQAVLDELRVGRRHPSPNQGPGSSRNRDANAGPEFQLFRGHYRDKGGAARCMRAHHREGTLITPACGRTMQELESLDLAGLNSMFAVHLAVLGALFVYSSLAAVAGLGSAARGWRKKLDSEEEVRARHRRVLRTFRLSLVWFGAAVVPLYGVLYCTLSTFAQPRGLEALFSVTAVFVASYAVPSYALRE